MGDTNDVVARQRGIVNEHHFNVVRIIVTPRCGIGRIGSVQFPRLMDPKPVGIDNPQVQIVHLDRLRFSLLLRNLINNALRYGEERPITIDVKFFAEKALLTVADKGKGIAAEHIDHLTEPFYRADSSRQRQTGGFGLGLYLCKLIAEAHGGHLELQSTEGEGTIVLVSIPLT